MVIKLHTVTTLLQVYDMGASLRFYRDLLGLPLTASHPVGDDPTWAELEVGEVRLMLNTAYEAGERPDAPDPLRVKVHGDTVLFVLCESVAAVDEAFQRLTQAGWPAEPPSTSNYGMRQVHTADPDGYEVCFQHPTG